MSSCSCDHETFSTEQMKTFLNRKADVVALTQLQNRIDALQQTVKWLVDQVPVGVVRDNGIDVVCTIHGFQESGDGTCEHCYLTRAMKNGPGLIDQMVKALEEKTKS